MFHKPGSSLGAGPNKKKSMDVAVKKSDRRTLKLVAMEMVIDNADECSSIFQSAFLEGELLKRKLTLPEGKVTMYIRKHRSSEKDKWPYEVSAQVVLMSLETGKARVVHVPSLALLSLLPPNSIPSVTIPSAASKYLCRGAHLMRAGMLSVSNAEVVCVVVKGNPQPMAVGCLTQGTNNETIGQNAKGVGVEIITCLGDDIWKNQLPSKSNQSEAKTRSVQSPIGGASFDDGHYGNVGFIEGTKVQPIVSISSEKMEDNEEQLLSDKVYGQDEQQPPEEGVCVEQTTTDEDGQNTESQHGQDTSEDADVNPHDAVLHESVCKALAVIRKSDLPITAANFYANFVLQHRTNDINLKKTTYKKFGKYLAVQVERGLLACGPDETNRFAFVTSVNRSHPDLKPYRNESHDSKLQKKTKMALVTLFVVPNHVASLMRLDKDDVKGVHAKSSERRGTGMLTSPEVRAILDKYIVANELVDHRDPRRVEVDGPLCDALYKKETTRPTTVLRKDLTTDWTNKMEQAYALVEMPGNRINKLARGKPPKVSIEVSMRQGRKFVTRVRGLEEFGIHAMEFSKDVAKRFACSATAEVNPEGRKALKKGHVELVLQGHLSEELRALLLGDASLTSHGGARDSVYCLPKSAIEVDLKKGVPSKKKR